MGTARDSPMDTNGDPKVVEDGVLNGNSALDVEKGANHLDVDELGTRGMRVTFESLEYVVVNANDHKQKLSLLQNVSGYLNPGQMTAIMGPSGSGKSTLLDILAGRKTQGELKGQVLFAGYQPTQTFLRRYTGYVEQFDTLLPLLTVTEMLLYTAQMKRPVSESFESKKSAVDALIERLALTRCKDTQIGSNVARGISGGEAKRTNIGISLVSNPRVLFLDEPTSGLDSYTSHEVMGHVKGLIADGITIAATIHSPTPATFDLFDRVLIIQRGRVVYFGQNNTQAIDFFQSGYGPECGEVREMGVKDNLAEWLVDITVKADRAGHSAILADKYEQSDLKKENDEQLKVYTTQQKSNVSKTTMEQLQTQRATVTPFWWALLMLFRYRTLRNLRDGQWMGARLGDKVIYVFIIFTLFWSKGDELNNNNVFNVAGILFLWVSLPSFGAAAYTPAIVLERPVFVRELSDGLYKVITYLCYKITEELMVALVVSLLASLPVFFVVKLQGSWAIVWAAFFVTLSIGIVLAYFIGALSPTMDIANAALPAYVVTLLFFSGFIVRWSEIPWYWRWYGYIDFIRYAFGALMINQFEDTGIEVFGEPVLDYFSLSSNSAWEFIGFEIIFFAVFFVAAWFALTFVKWQKR